MKVAIYARYSTDLQDKTSIAGQVANCEAIASREGFDVVARFQDEAQRGDDDRRPGASSATRRAASPAIRPSYTVSPPT